jgi:hypothetical protein
MSLIKKVSHTVLPAIFALTAAQGFATDLHPPQGSVRIKSIEPKGTGCPTKQSVSTNISSDGKAFTVTFSQFEAAIGNGLEPTAARKNCSLLATLDVPAGWQFSIATFNYRGYMQLDYGIKATHATQYWFQGETDTGYVKAEVSGPAARDFIYSDKVGLSSVYIPDRWSPCNKSRALVINPSVSLRKLPGADANAQGYIANDSVDGDVDNVFGLVWRRCS